MADARLTRRAFLRSAGVGAAGVAIGGSTLLAACSKSDAKLHEVRVYNEPLSMDDVTPESFEKATGVFLRYHEYTDPAEYLARSTSALRAHRDIGADVVIIGDHQTAEVIEAGWVRPLTKAGRNRGKVLPPFADPHFDPGRQFSLPWLSTVVGLAYDRRWVTEPIRSAGALFDPRFAGKVALSADPEATLGLVALASGNQPATITETQAAAAVDRVRAGVASGQVRSFATTEYIDDLVSGRAHIAIARSSEIRDALQISPTIAFVVPTEGGLLESTNMLIPTGARNPVAARDFIDFMFRPEVISRVASFAGRTLPIKGGVSFLESIDVKASVDPLIEPDPTVWKRLSVWGGPPQSAAAVDFVALAASDARA